MDEGRVGSWGRSALVNAAAAFVLAAMVNGLLHELAHAVAGLAQGLTPTVTPFSVDYQPEPTTGQQIVTALAGPLWSLFMGVALLVVARSWGSGLVRLFWLWLGFMGVMNFAGYLLIAPFIRAGDTAQALSLLGAPGWVFVLAAVLGAALQFGLANLFAGQVKRYTDGITDERVLAFRAWAVGTLVVILLTVVQLVMVGPPAGVVVAVVAYSFAVGVFAPMQFIFRGRVAQRTNDDPGLDRVSRAGLGVTLALAAALLVLGAVGGLSLG